MGVADGQVVVRAGGSHKWDSGEAAAWGTTVGQLRSKFLTKQGLDLGDCGVRSRWPFVGLHICIWVGFGGWGSMK